VYNRKIKMNINVRDLGITPFKEGANSRYLVCGGLYYRGWSIGMPDLRLYTYSNDPEHYTGTWTATPAKYLKEGEVPTDRELDIMDFVLEEAVPRLQRVSISVPKETTLEDQEQAMYEGLKTMIKYIDARIDNVQ
jgi:hypothetical protein